MRCEKFRIDVLGNAGECRTEAEISCGDEVVALVFETTEGWHTELANSRTVNTDDPEFATALTLARSTLERYVNRVGANRPDGLTQAGLSFWLMEKTDGTSMGAKIEDA
jgi:hypothetical protein